MTITFKHTFSIFTVTILTQIATSAFACTCIGKDKQTTESELNFSDIAVKGKVIAVSGFYYYDTVGSSMPGRNFDEKKEGYLIRKYRVFNVVVDKKYKSPKNMSDTIQIVTGYGGGDCGYEFEVGKDYIIYGEQWKENKLSVKHRKRKDKYRIIDTTIANKFYTDICRLTQEATTKELENLKRLTPWK